LAVDLRFDLRNALQMLGQFEQAIPFVREAEHIARDLNDPRRLGLVAAYLSWYCWVTGRYTDALRFAREVLSSAETLNDLPLRVVSHFYHGTAHLAAGDYARAAEFLREVGGALGSGLSHQRLGLAGYPAAMSRCFLPWALGEQGRFIEGIEQGREGVRIAEAVDHPYSLIMTCWGLGHLYCIKGDFHEATPLLERALGLARERNVAILLPLTARPLGYARALTGRIDEGIALLREALTGSQSMGMRLFRALYVAQLGEASLLAERREDGRRLAKEALTIARELGERGHEAYALRLLGEVATNGDLPDVETGEGHYRAALALANELGMRPLAAHCHLGLAKFYRRTGEAAKATEHLTTATAMYREMDMGFWLAQAEAV
jgi:tetratricopeptide (TPR) repeat protein